MSEIGRRFSLDKVNVDPTLKNKIFSADGDDHIGDWNGECIDQLIKEIDQSKKILIVDECRKSGCYGESIFNNISSSVVNPITTSPISAAFFINLI